MKINQLTPVNGGGYFCPEVVKTQIKVEKGFAASVNFEGTGEYGELPGAGEYDFTNEPF